MLERSWGACDAAGNCAEAVNQTVTVIDRTAPLEQYLDATLDGSGDPMPVLCINGRNRKWISIVNAARRSVAGFYNVENPAAISNNIEQDLFGLQKQLTNQLEYSELRWQFYDAASVSVRITNCTNSACNDTAGCFYNATRTILSTSRQARQISALMKSEIIISARFSSPKAPETTPGTVTTCAIYKAVTMI